MKYSLASIVLPLLAAAAPMEIVERQTSGCQPVSVFYARGTGEPTDNGIIVGPSLEKNLKTAFNNALTYTPISYPASIAGDIPGDQGQGTTAFVAAINSELQKCPNTKVVITGYSQGGWLIHDAAKSLNKPIAAAVSFGDPDKKNVPTGCSASNYKTFCAAGDPVCGNGFDIAAHLSYGSDTEQAAQFIKGAIGSGSTGSTSTSSALASSASDASTTPSSGALSALLGADEGKYGSATSTAAAAAASTPTASTGGGLSALLTSGSSSSGADKYGSAAAASTPSASTGGGLSALLTSGGSSSGGSTY